MSYPHADRYLVRRVLNFLVSTRCESRDLRIHPGTTFLPQASTQAIPKMYPGYAQELHRVIHKVIAQMSRSGRVDAVETKKARQVREHPPGEEPASLRPTVKGVQVKPTHLRLVQSSGPGREALAERIKLALSIIDHRKWHEDNTRDIRHVERALQGATIAEIAERD